MTDPTTPSDDDPQPRRLRYRGVNRSGTAVTGAARTSPAELAEELYRKRYHEVEITDGGVSVGGIGQSGDRKYTWWGEERRDD